MSMEYMFCFFFCSEQCINIISPRKMYVWLSSVFKKIIPNNTTPTFQKVGGVTKPLTFCRWQRTSHGIALTITKLIDFYSQCILTLLFATAFN